MKFFEMHRRLKDAYLFALMRGEVVCLVVKCCKVVRWFIRTRKYA